MIPFLETGITLATTQGYDLLARNTKAVKSKFGRTTQPDTWVDLGLAAVAIAPQLLNVLGPSPLVERFMPLSLPTLYRLHKARPYLAGASLAALAALGLRQRMRGTEGKAFGNSVRVVGVLRTMSHFVSAPTALTPHDEGHLVVTPRELNRLLEPDDLVLGLHLNGEARCYPLEILRKPHLIHDTVGQVPVVPTFCEFTNTAIAFRDEWQGERLDLEVAGFPNNNIVFYEKHSDGMIQQLDARLGAGPNAGDTLQTFPLTLTSWRRWREMHPETTGLWYDQSVKGNALKEVLKRVNSYDMDQPEPLFAVKGGVDPRLPAKEQVFGVRVRNEARAYTRAYLRQHPVINEELGGEPIVILYDAQRDVASAFHRRFEDHVLTFEHVAHGKGVAEDKEAGHMWDVTGSARFGRDVEKSLKPVPFAIDRAYWFAWAHFYPQTRIAGRQDMAVAR